MVFSYRKIFFGKLPNLKEVVGKCLTFKDYKTDGIKKVVLKELHNLWITYNVYPISVNGIHKQLKTMIMEFNKRVQYDKKKRSKNYKNDVDIFLKKNNTFFDIYQPDPEHFSDTEKKQMLKMTEPDF